MATSMEAGVVSRLEVALRATRIDSEESRKESKAEEAMDEFTIMVGSVAREALWEI